MDFGMILKHFLLYGTLIPKPDSTEVQMMDLWAANLILDIIEMVMNPIFSLMGKK